MTDISSLHSLLDVEGVQRMEALKVTASVRKLNFDPSIDAKESQFAEASNHNMVKTHDGNPRSTNGAAEAVGVKTKQVDKSVRINVQPGTNTKPLSTIRLEDFLDDNPKKGVAPSNQLQLQPQSQQQQPQPQQQINHTQIQQQPLQSQQLQELQFQQIQQQLQQQQQEQLRQQQLQQMLQQQQQQQQQLLMQQQQQQLQQQPQPQQPQPQQLQTLPTNNANTAAVYEISYTPPGSLGITFLPFSIAIEIVNDMQQVLRTTIHCCICTRIPSAAARTIKEGDVLLSVNGHPLCATPQCSPGGQQHSLAVEKVRKPYLIPIFARPYLI